MSQVGTVKFFNTRKGYGFVTHSDSQTDYFVHTSDVQGQQLKEGDNVNFEIAEGNDGRSKAIDVTGGTGGEKDQFNRGQRDQGGFGGRGGFGNRGGYGDNDGGFNRFGGNQGGYGGGNSYGGNSGGYNRRPGGNSYGDKKICYNWRDNGQCRFGDTCRFSHDVDQGGMGQGMN